MTVAAITGVGAVTPLGVGVDALYSGWKAGRSGIVDGQGACLEFEPTDFLTRKEARRADRSSQLLLVAGDEALAQAGWGAPGDELPYAPERVGSIIGSGIGGFITLTENHKALLEGKPVSPLAIPLLMANGPTGQIALRRGLLGPSWGPSAPAPPVPTRSPPDSASCGPGPSTRSSSAAPRRPWSTSPAPASPR